MGSSALHVESEMMLPQAVWPEMLSGICWLSSIQESPDSQRSESEKAPLKLVDSMKPFPGGG
eukprot:8315141-Lingulodinium_polyedra.AAC.1